MNAQDPREGMAGDSTLKEVLYAVRAQTLPKGLEARLFLKSNKSYPTYRLMHKVWSKVKQLRQVRGFTAYSPIWSNQDYPELARGSPYGINDVIFLIMIGCSRSINAK